MELYDVMRTTAAVRQYTGEPLTDEVLHTILENARFAPSGGNRQGTHLVVVRDPDTRQRLRELSIPAARRYAAQIDAGESPWNPVAPPSPTAEEIAATDPPSSLLDPLVTADVVLVVCLDLGVVAALDQDLDRIGIVGGGSVFPLVWNILLAARHEGFGGTLSTMAVAAEPQVRDLLGIPDGHAVACLLPLGRPVKQLTKLRRVAVADLTHLERWGGGPLAPHDD